MTGCAVCGGFDYRHDPIAHGAEPTWTDVELHIWRQRPDDAPTTGDGPKLEASGGGSSERASTFGDPMTIAGFGFQSRQWRAPRDGGYHPRVSTPEPTIPPQGPAGTSPR